MHFKDPVQQHKDIYCGDKIFKRIGKEFCDAENKQAIYTESGPRVVIAWMIM